MIDFILKEIKLKTFKVSSLKRAPYEPCQLYGAKLKFIKGFIKYRYYATKNKTIWLNCDTKIDRDSLNHVFCHELAHHLQSLILKKHPNRDLIYYNLSKYETSLAYEIQAERIAYKIYKQYLAPLQKKKLHHTQFNLYRCKHDKQFLARFMNCCSSIKCINKDCLHCEYLTKGD